MTESPSAKKSIMAVTIGTVLEFYDFALFGFMVPTIGPLFFPASDPLATLMMGFSLFALSFIVRPLGGLLFGMLGDVYGRKVALSSSLIVTSFVTTVIGFLPTYEQVGIGAPLLLILLRLVQGLCLGGEYTGALITMSELRGIRDNRPAFFSAVISSAGVSGWFLAILVCSASAQIESSDYVWRLPFLTGAFVGICGIFLRAHLLEPPQKHPMPKRLLFGWSEVKAHLPILFGIAGVGVCMGAFFYGLFIFPNGYVPLHFNMSKSEVMTCTSLGIGAYMVALPLMGLLADWQGQVRCMRASAALMVLSSPYLILGIMSGQFLQLALSEMVAGVLLGGFMAPAMSLVSISVSPHLRYRFVSLSYNLGACLLGGTGPAISLFLIAQFDTTQAPALYLALCSGVGVWASFMLRATSNIQREIT